MSCAAFPISPRFDRVLLTVCPTESVPGEPPTVPVDRHVDLARALREAGFRQFGFCVATHYPAAAGVEGGDRVRVTYGLRTLGKGSELAVWQVDVSATGAVPTLSHLFAGADWQEREQWDLVGVRFEGHPDLRRLMLPEDWAGHPLRKDYAIDTRVPPWR